MSTTHSDADATDQEPAAGRDLDSCPRQHNDDRTQSYQTQGLRRIAGESSPSAGWRAVYAEMGVSPR